MVGSSETDGPDGSPEQPILVNEDHDAPQSGIGFEVERLVQQVQKGDARFNPIDLDGEDENLSEDPWRADEEKYDHDNAKIEREELPNEPEDTQDGPCVHWKKGIRNPCPCGTHQKVPKVTIGSIELGKSHVVELKESVRVGRYEAEFVEVHEIWVPYKANQTFIRGRTYARTRNLEGRIVPRMSEVCEIYELDENDHRANNPDKYLQQALVEVPTQNIKTVRTLHKTNKAFPECRFDRTRYRTKGERENEAPLTCRWEMVLSYPDPRYRRQQRPIAGEEIRHYGQKDIPKDRHRIPDIERRRARAKIRGGSFIPNGAPEANPEPPSIHLAPGQKYAAVDCFSGAGGVSMGAEMAGLKVLAACDHWPRCCETYRENFPGVELHQEDIYKFIEDMSTDLTREHFNVDVLHFSPPCQTWSPAHTCEGKKDEENRATLYACEKLLIIFKPRIFTVEQTFGLAQDRWIPNFNALLQGFTRHGYSVKWKVLHLVEYGLPQTRKRLVMMGAAPGEQLPAWPPPTHSKDPKGGQKPLVSASEACSVLVEGENLHDVEGARPASKAPWDSSKPLGRTVTCSGGQCHHWSGDREFTLAEFSAIQGFPADFRFVGKCIKKQIGNAFAPIVVKVLLKCIRVHLENFDGVTRQPPPGQSIIVSDDDDDNHDHDRPQPQSKDQVQSQIESQLVVEGLVSSHVRQSGPRQEFLQVVVEDVCEGPVQWLREKVTRKPSKGGVSSGQSLWRSTPGGSRHIQATQTHALESHLVPVNEPNNPTVDVGNNTAASQCITTRSFGPTCQIPSISDDTTTIHTTSTGRSINTGIMTVPTRRDSPDSDEPRARRSAQTAATIADLNPSGRQTRSATNRTTTGRSSGQTIVGGVLNAPVRDESDSDNDRVVRRRSVRTARTIADLDYSPRPTRSASSSLRGPGHRSARTAQTLGSLDEESSVGRSAFSDAAAAATRQRPRTGRIVAGVLTIPGRQSPPGFTDVAPLYQAPPPATQSAASPSGVVLAPVPRAAPDNRAFNNSAPSEGLTHEEAMAGVVEAASRSRIFPGLAEKLQGLELAEDDAAAAGLPGTQSSQGLAAAAPDENKHEGQDSDVATAEPAAPRRTTTTTTTARGGLLEGAVSSSARLTGIRATQASGPSGAQAGEDTGGPSRRSSGDSVAYVGESSRAGATASMPWVIDDEEDEEDDDEMGGYGEGAHGGDGDGNDADEDDEDEDQKLQRAIKMSMEGVAPTREGRVDVHGFDPDEMSRAFEASILDACRRADQEPEDLYGAIEEDAPAPQTEPELEMYGPGDYKGKGKAVKPREFDEYAEDDEEAERNGGPSKRPRRSK